MSAAEGTGDARKQLTNLRIHYDRLAERNAGIYR